MKFSRVLAAGALLLAIAGCKSVDIKDGKIPDAYISQAKKIEGVYTGKFNGVAGELVITIEGNKPVVTFRNSAGDDILNNNCHSFFGNLTTVYLKGSKGDYSLSGATFAFNAGACSLMVQGREMNIDFKQTDKGVRLNLSLLREVRQNQVCQWSPGAPPNVPPQQICRWEQTPYYLNGSFSR
ncbi:hypothetical protein [Bdellovibrio sp. NC01]|uniref:hypothetical protein n=1 Tax=Bdellovibrio sp. NC01 TaxID=2220073 RepID=UPI00115B2203|nr:hypothetical protein [Bdellovibrio sp. NC01]QDK36573.1 hypothetical protein DOE51_02640 [Bdellovibrio sp. NC01]